MRGSGPRCDSARPSRSRDISAESVKTHMTKLFKKLGAANRTEAVAIALETHLLKG